MRGFILYPDYSTEEGKTYVKLYGRLENGQSFLSVHQVHPYFFITEKEYAPIAELLKRTQVEKTKLTTFQGEKVVKITGDSYGDLQDLAKELHKAGIHTYESDIRPQYRFIIDNNLLGSIEIEGEHKPSKRVERVYDGPKIKPAQFVPTLKVVSIDIESGKKADELFCIGLSAQGYKKNFMITTKKLENTISCATEKECLEKFKKEIIALDPDIITGWNVIDFDFDYLHNLFKKYKLPFDIGRNEESLKLRIEEGFFRPSSVDIPGRQILDGLNLIRDPFIQEAPSIKQAEFESFTLEDVAQQILKKGKLIKGENRHEEIATLFHSDNQEQLQKLVNYNLMDCELAYNILEKTQMIELAVERSQLTGLPLDRMTSSILAFDSLYIREARKHNLVSPTTTYGQKETRIKGGYVYSSKPGIYHNVVILDFKSLYPSLIRTFNIDPASFLEKKEKEAIEAPNGAFFKNQEGLLPQILERLHQAREKAKKEKRELSSYAIKIIMNSFFGVLASPNCRYFNLSMANAITHFGQHVIKLTAKQIEEKGVKVIYSDTDSVFVETGLEKGKANKLGKEIEEDINAFYKQYIKEKYNRNSVLELEFEKQYLSMMIPNIRGSEIEKAAKKRYAGMIEKDGKEELEIVGLEAIRGDWTEAAKEFQKELLEKAFHKEPVELFIKGYIKKIRDGKMDSQLIYRKSIRKSLDEYTKTTPPHVKAARQLEKLDSNVIQYVMTQEGPEPIQKIKHKIDYEHYIEKQIEPIASQILSLLHKKFEDISKDQKQTKLF